MKSQISQWFFVFLNAFDVMSSLWSGGYSRQYLHQSKINNNSSSNSSRSKAQVQFEGKYIPHPASPSVSQMPKWKYYTSILVRNLIWPNSIRMHRVKSLSLSLKTEIFCNLFLAPRNLIPNHHFPIFLFIASGQVSIICKWIGDTSN